jgi:hypothetical protein
MLLKFPSYVKELEMSRHWDLILRQLVKEWQTDRACANSLLCAGIALWYCLVFEDELEFDAALDRELLLDQLNEITQYGWKNFSENWKFNMFFGFMISLYPYFWGDWDNMYAKASEMLKTACLQESENLIPRIWYYGSFCERALYEETKAAARKHVIESFPPDDDANVIELYFRGMLLPLSG